MGGLLEGRVALVTASGDGIGHELALGLEDAGATVATTGQLATRAAVALGFGTAADVYGRVDLVVHAHTDPDALTVAELAATDESAWERRCEALVRQAFWVAQSAHAAFAGRGGHLVFVTPTVGLSGAIGLAPYASAVEAVRALAKGAARQWGEAGIRVNCVAPPVEIVLPEAGVTGPWLAPVALGRTPDARTDVAPAVALLSAEAAHFVTGTTLVVDGGIVMAP